MFKVFIGASWLKAGCVAGGVLLALAAQAQGLDPDWKESEAPAPPAYSVGRLLPIDMPHYVSLRVGVDPQTLLITPDGIVRYVMMAVNSNGSVNAMYEGIRCATGEVKTYARHSGQGNWSMVKEPSWRPFTDNLPSKHAWIFARQGACDGRAMATGTVAEIIKNLKR